MELAAYLRIVSRRKWAILLTVLVVAVVFFIGQRLIPPSYTATTVLRVTPYASGEPPYTQLIYADRIMNTYIKLATSGPYLEELRARLGLDKTQPAGVLAELVPESELLNITIEDRDPILASTAANTLAEMLVNGNPIREIKITIVDPAIVPEPPTVMKQLIFAALALIIGLLVGVGIAFLLENLDTRLHSSEQIKKVTGLPILGQVPPVRSWQNTDFLAKNQTYADSIRRLQTNIFARIQEPQLRTIMFTSATPQEGKSTIAINLAKSIALRNRRVLLVDADFHRRSIHRALGLPNKIGFSDVLMRRIPLSDAIGEVSGISVLSSGPEPPNPIELLGSDRMIEILAELADRFDLVLIDTPAFLGVADSAFLAPLVDGVLVVTRRGIKEAPLSMTCQQLENLHANLLGVIINRAEVKLPRKYRKYYDQMRREQGTPSPFGAVTNPDKSTRKDGKGAVATGAPIDAKDPQATSVDLQTHSDD